jgi:uncharacterized protein (TIGR02246 family)
VDALVEEMHLVEEIVALRKARGPPARDALFGGNLLDAPVGGTLRPRRERTMAHTASGEIRSVIAAANEKLMAAFRRGDAAGVAAAYTEDGEVLPPNSDVTAGRQNIQAFWQGAMKMGITALQLETVEAAGSGDMATEVGRYALQGPGGQVIDEGKYIVIWKQEAGQLKVHRDIWNSNRPASG